jgi:hypothetical protein
VATDGSKIGSGWQIGQINFERQDRVAINDLGASRRSFQSRAFLRTTNLDLVGAFVRAEWEAGEDPAAL